MKTLSRIQKIAGMTAMLAGAVCCFVGMAPLGLSFTFAGVVVFWKA